MGYTHYWRTAVDADPAKLAAAGRRMADVIEAANVPLAGPLGEGSPNIDRNAGTVSFNGVGPDDDHETFAWPPDLGARFPNLNAGETWESDVQTGPLVCSRSTENGREYGFEFCKTARKPYDPVVVACLLAALEVLGDDILVSSDGTLGEFLGSEMSEGWRQVNAMLDSPTEAPDGETAYQLYVRVFGKEPPIPAEMLSEATA